MLIIATLMLHTLPRSARVTQMYQGVSTRGLGMFLPKNSAPLPQPMFCGEKTSHTDIHAKHVSIITQAAPNTMYLFCGGRRGARQIF